MRILLADDHVLLTDLLASNSQSVAPDLLVETAIDLDQMLRLSPEPAISLIILDLHMPGMNGFSGIAVVRRRFPGVPIALLSGDSGADVVASARAAGAVGFIPKTIGFRAIFAGILTMAAGGLYFPGEASGGETSLANTAAGASTLASHAISALTRRERDVLRSLCAGSSNLEIAQKLRLEPVTVGLYLRNVYRKLGVRSRTQAVKFCLESGIDI